MAEKSKPRELKLNPNDPTLVKIKALREQLKLVQEDLADRANRSVSYMSRLETGLVDPTLQDLRHISASLAVPIAQLVSDDLPGAETAIKSKIYVEGEVAAGRYVEFVGGARVDFERFESVFPPDPRHPVAAQFDLKVSGSSLNRFARDGEYLRCVHLLRAEMMKRPVEISDGDYVIFERTRDGGQLIEVTAKRYQRRGDRIELWPDSDDEQWQAPTILQNDATEGEEGRVIALVLYTYKPARR